jgi:hypothetical protein
MDGGGGVGARKSLLSKYFFCATSTVSYVSGSTNDAGGLSVATTGASSNSGDNGGSGDDDGKYSSNGLPLSFCLTALLGSPLPNIGIAVRAGNASGGGVFSDDGDAGGEGTHKRMRCGGGGTCSCGNDGNDGVGERKPTFRESLRNSVGISGDCERGRLPRGSVCISGDAERECRAGSGVSCATCFSFLTRQRFCFCFLRREHFCHTER